MTEYVIGCPRCGDDIVRRDDLDPEPVCWFCQAELAAYYDYQLDWREAYEKEKDRDLYRKIKHDPNYVAHVLSNYERTAQDIAAGIFTPDDPGDFLNRLSKSRADFETRWTRVQKLISEGRAWLL